MDTYTGHIEYKLVGQGSKSEGFIACLVTSSGESYRLYREGAIEIDDDFFGHFDQQEVEISGELEETGFICVDSVKTLEGLIIHVPEQQLLPTDLVFQPNEELDEKKDCINEEKVSDSNKPVLIPQKRKKSRNNFKRKKK